MGCSQVKALEATVIARRVRVSLNKGRVHMTGVLQWQKLIFAG
jgi:hypothetical protein